MGVRLLVMFSFLVLELAGGIAVIVAGIMPSYGPVRNDEIAEIVMTVAGILVAWLVTIAIFVRKSSRARARRVVEEARLEAGRILGDATNRALALCSLDAGRCARCGNPRTGKFCPQCGAVGAGDANAAVVAGGASR